MSQAFLVLVIYGALSICFTNQQSPPTTKAPDTTSTTSMVKKEEMNFTDIHGNYVNKTTYCSDKPCIYKCCKFGQLLQIFSKGMLGYRCVNDTNSHRGVIDPDVHDEHMKVTGKRVEESFNLLSGVDIVGMGFYLYPNFYLHLMVDGSLTLESPNAYKRWIPTNEEFCLDHVIRFGEEDVVVDGLVVLGESDTPDDDVSSSPIITICGMYISSVFMAAVLAVYGYLPQLRNLHGKVLIAYVSSLMVAFIGVATLQLSGELGIHSEFICHTFSLLNYFSLLAAFFWMNVMSFDIYWTFRGIAKARAINRRGENHKFRMYCLYGFGCPLGMTVALAIVNYLPMRDINRAVITPGITDKGCFLQDIERLIYLYTPLSALILANTLLFISTIWNLCQVRRETRALRSADSSAQKSTNRLILYVKVFMLMGLNWCLEIISTLNSNYKNSLVWKFTDAYNLFAGVIIFIIFVCKKKIFKMLLARYHKRNEAGNSSARRNNSSRSASSSTGTVTLDPDFNTEVVVLNPKGERRFGFEESKQM